MPDCRRCNDTGELPDSDDLCRCDASFALMPECQWCDAGWELVDGNAPIMLLAPCQCAKGKRRQLELDTDEP